MGRARERRPVIEAATPSTQARDSGKVLGLTMPPPILERRQDGPQRLFMEYDTDRAGGFEPLRFLPKNEQIVLGVMTSKSGAGEQRTAQVPGPLLHRHLREILEPPLGLDEAGDPVRHRTGIDVDAWAWSRQSLDRQYPVCHKRRAKLPISLRETPRWVRLPSSVVALIPDWLRRFARSFRCRSCRRSSSDFQMTAWRSSSRRIAASRMCFSSSR